jgi:hypothetical protein
VIDHGCPRNSSICPIPQTPQGSGLTHITVEVPRGERRTFSFGGCSTDLDSELLESIKPVLVQSSEDIYLGRTSNWGTTWPWYCVFRVANWCSRILCPKIQVESHTSINKRKEKLAKFDFAQSLPRCLLCYKFRVVISPRSLI